MELSQRCTDRPIPAAPSALALDARQVQPCEGSSAATGIAITGLQNTGPQTKQGSES